MYAAPLIVDSLRLGLKGAHGTRHNKFFPHHELFYSHTQVLGYSGVVVLVLSTRSELAYIPSTRQTCESALDF
jgi:hypothetical protein